MSEHIPFRAHRGSKRLGALPRTNARTQKKLKIRAIRPSDAELYESILTRTSAEDRYCRFFHAVSHFERSDIMPYVDSSPDVIGLIAEDGLNAYGAAHAFYLSPNEVELAIVVAGNARRRGVGHALFERLLRIVNARRCSSVTAYSLPLNHAFAHLAKSVGMIPTGPTSDVVTWTLPPLKMTA